MRIVFVGAGQVGEAAGARFESLAEYDPTDFHPSRSLARRMATIEEMARTWKDEKETGGGLKRGEKTEVNGILGFIVRDGERLNVSTPLCLAALKVFLEVESAGGRSAPTITLISMG
jgi:ketopantoate reductase